MKYKYVCKNCGNTQILNIPMGNDLPNKIACVKCETFMFQDYSDKMNGLKIGLDFQATSEFKPKNYNIGGSSDLESYREDL